MRTYINNTNAAINPETTKQRCKNFISEFGTPVTVFAQKIGISASSYHRWQKGFLKLADDTVERISDFLDKYGY